MHQVEQLIGQLDRAPAMIRLEVVMGDVPTADLPAADAATKGDAGNVRASPVGVGKIQKKMEVLFSQPTDHARQPAGVHPTRSPRTDDRLGEHVSHGQNTSVTVQNLGSKVSFTPRANGDRVVTMTLDIEDSRLAPANEGVPIFTPNKGEPVRTPVIELVSIQTTIKLANGQTMLLCDITARQETASNAWSSSPSTCCRSAIKRSSKQQPNRSSRQAACGRCRRDFAKVPPTVPSHGTAWQAFQPCPSKIRVKTRCLLACVELGKGGWMQDTP